MILGLGPDGKPEPYEKNKDSTGKWIVEMRTGETLPRRSWPLRMGRGTLRWHLPQPSLPDRFFPDPCPVPDSQFSHNTPVMKAITLISSALLITGSLLRAETPSGPLHLAPAAPTLAHLEKTGGWTSIFDG